MVDAVLTLDSSGALKRLEMKGHAGYSGMRLSGRKKPEMNPVCGIISMTARSVARLIASRPGWTVDGNAPKPGNLSLVVIERPKDTDEWLKGVTETLIQALADVAQEYPNAVSVHIEESFNGS